MGDGHPQLQDATGDKFPEANRKMGSLTSVPTSCESLAVIWPKAVGCSVHEKVPDEFPFDERKHEFLSDALPAARGGSNEIDLILASDGAGAYLMDGLR